MYTRVTEVLDNEVLDNYEIPKTDIDTFEENPTELTLVTDEAAASETALNAFTGRRNRHANIFG